MNGVIIAGILGLIVIVYIMTRKSEPYVPPTSTVLPDGTVVNNPDFAGVFHCFYEAQLTSVNQPAGRIGAEAYYERAMESGVLDLEYVVGHWKKNKSNIPESCWPK